MPHADIGTHGLQNTLFSQNKPSVKPIERTFGAVSNFFYHLIYICIRAEWLPKKFEKISKKSKKGIDKGGAM